MGVKRTLLCLLNISISIVTKLEQITLNGDYQGGHVTFALKPLLQKVPIRF